jgi:tetratricopeptide (TPR) repeat protein
VKTLHLDLKPIVNGYVELRYFFNNPNQYASRSLPVSEIAELVELAVQGYYLPQNWAILRARLSLENYAETGRSLYNWLDGSDRFLTQLLTQYPGEGVVLAIAAAENLAHLPWELLHDDNRFLVQRVPGVVPVRWVALGAERRLSIAAEPENRALNVLFMAASPLSVEPVLDFEAEEGRILEATATARQPLSLIVEESGCLSELGYLANYYGKGHFDVLHLTGHATFADDQPRFITETETGAAEYASAEDIARELQFTLPKLIFLSGCHTGQAGKSGAVPSMAEELLKFGAKAVLGWGEKVLDHEAKEAAAALYQALSSGKEVAEAVACTYQTLLKNQARDWHLLRLYTAGNLPGELVTPKGKPNRQPAPVHSIATQFLDPAGTVKVPTRESFIGRRRQLQSCLRALTQPSEVVGVLIHGMGGLGKSSLAARLCDRLPNFERVVWVGHLDEANLVYRLAEKLLDQNLRQDLQNPEEELKFRLRRVFLQLQAAQPFLLVLDDFEANLVDRNSSFVLNPEPATVLGALVWAIRETHAAHRLILTCRYDFASSQLQYFYKQPMEALRGADLRKKCDYLAAFSAKSQVDQALQSQAKRLADGNPRLLEWLDKILQNSTVDQKQILDRLETDAIELREQVLAMVLLEQIDQPMREMLQQAWVFELPVPREAMTTVCAAIPNLEQQLNRAVALGLLEVRPDESLRVSRILPLQLPADAETLHQQAAEVLYRLWWEEEETSTEEQVREIHRLALSGKVEKIAVEIAKALSWQWINTSRFWEAVKTCQDTLEVFQDYRILHALARSEQELGDIQLAQEHYQQALSKCPPADESQKATIIHNLASIYADTGNLEQAIALYQQSLDLNEQMGNLQGKAATLHQLAIIYANTGDIAQAIALCQQSLDLNEQIGDVQGKAPTLNQLASIYADTGDIAQAIALCQQSLEIKEQIGDVLGKAATLHQLAIIYANTGKIEQAIALYQQSLELFEQIGHVRGKAATLHQLAIIYANTGNIEQAIALYQQSLELKEQIGHVQGKAATLHQLASIYANTGNIEQAIALYQQSLELKEQIGDVQGKAATLHQLASIYANTGNIEQAIALYQQSLELKEQIGHVRGKAATLHCLAIIYANTGDIEQAIALYQQSLELTEQIGDVLGKAATLHQLAIIYANTGDIEQAITLYQQSLDLKEQIGDVQGKAATLASLGWLLATEQGDFATALNYLQQSLEILQHLRSPEAEQVQQMIASLQQRQGKQGRQGGQGRKRSFFRCLRVSIHRLLKNLHLLAP